VSPPFLIIKIVGRSYGDMVAILKGTETVNAVRPLAHASLGRVEGGDRTAADAADEPRVMLAHFAQAEIKDPY